MSDTCSLFPLFGDPWPSCLLPSHEDTLYAVQYMYCSHFSLTIVGERRIYVQHSVAVKKQSAHAGDAGDRGSIPGLRRSPGGGNGKPLQDACLENPMDRGSWQATIHGIANESDTTKHICFMYNKVSLNFNSLTLKSCF